MYILKETYIVVLYTYIPEETYIGGPMCHASGVHTACKVPM